MKTIVVSVLVVFMALFFPLCVSAGETVDVIEASIGNKVPAWYLKIDMTKFELRVVAARVPTRQGAEVANPERAPTGFSLEDYQRLYGARAVMSGGYLSSFAPPTPLGLVKSNNVIVNPAHNSWLVDGIYCYSSAKVVVELWKQKPNIGDFQDCLQAGPILLYNGDARSDNSDSHGAGYVKLAQSNQEQAFICTSANNQIAVGITGVTDFTTLIQFLKNEVGCVTALRLTGKDTAGLIVNDKPYGSVDQYLLPNALAVIPRN